MDNARFLDRGNVRRVFPAAMLAIASGEASHVEILRSTGGLAADVVGLFQEPAAFQRAPNGDYLVLDRRGHVVYRVPPTGTDATKIVQIGPETGRIVGPSALVLAGDRFMVADGPQRRERVQMFDLDGTRVSGFWLPGRATPRVTLDAFTLSGVSSLQWTGRSVLMSQPELGGLMTEFTLGGQPFRTLGVFRNTGHEANRDVHLALNSGLPLVDPTGGYFFVFHAGLPVFRKYDADGRLLFERHIEGPELDAMIQALPTRWPQLPDESGRGLPLIRPTVRAAAVDPNGNLWVSLDVPYTYVYDPNGEKIRTIQFQAAGTVSPNSLFFESRDRLLVTPGATSSPSERRWQAPEPAGPGLGLRFWCVFPPGARRASP